jgi:hypothetical protein
MKRLALLLSLLSAPLATLNLLAIMVGQVSGAGRTEMGVSADCRLPCWNGITPGQTRYNEAVNILETLGYQPKRSSEDGALPRQNTYQAASPMLICKVGLNRSRQLSSLVSEMTLEVCGSLPIGSVIDMIGPPRAIMPYISILDYSGGTTTVIVLRQRLCQMPLTPHHEVMFISVSEDASGELANTELPWRGFLPLWRYDRLYPGRVLC